MLTRFAGWEYIFYLNVPIGAAVLALVPRVVAEAVAATAGRPRLGATAEATG